MSAKIELDKRLKETVLDKLQHYFDSELEYELGQFEAEFLLDFLSKELGPVYYNQGLYDAQAILEQRIDNVKDAIFDLEK